MQFIDNLNDTQIQHYKARTQRAINGINKLLNNINLVVECSNIRCRYQTISEYIGLESENGISFYNYFIPLDSNIIILLRLANHNNINSDLFDQHEKNGKPNKRYIIVFSGNEFFNSEPTVFLGAEHHVITYPINALDEVESIKTFLLTLEKLLINGDVDFTSLPIPITENKQYTNMKKQTIKLNESQLRKVINESVMNMINEDAQYAMQMEYLSGLQKQQQALDVAVQNLIAWAKWFQTVVPKTIQQLSQQLQPQNNQQQLQPQNRQQLSQQLQPQNNQQQLQPQNRQQ